MSTLRPPSPPPAGPVNTTPAAAAAPDALRFLAQPMAQTLAPAASAAAASATKTTPPPAPVPSNLLPPAPPIVDPRSGRVVPAGGGLAQQPWGARPPLAKPPTHKYRARWASVHKIHSLFADGFPELEQRYVRERDAAERVYEYNLGTIEREPGGIDETGALRAAFRALDDACADADDAELADARRTFVEEMRKWSFRGARAPAALAETLSDCDGEDDEGRVVGVRARSPVVTPGEETGAPVLPPATQVAAPPPLSARGPDRGRAALDALLWQGMQELRDAYHVLAAERRPAPRPPPVVEALAPATERPSAGLNALALATQMEL